jgi:hypothetical protein
MVMASDYDQSRFMKAADFTADKKLKIREVTEEDVGTDKNKERKLVVWFTNDKRGLVLNRVNNRTIRGAYGDDVAGWTGKIIAVFPTMAEFRGTMGPALRVRVPPPKQAAATPTSQPVSPAGNGGAAAPAADPELESNPVKSTATEVDELNDEIPEKW